MAAAAQVLTGLYRRLGDGKQAARAIQAGSSAEDRCRRLGLLPRIGEQCAQIRTAFPDEMGLEAHAWRLLVEGQAGLSAFYAVVDQDENQACRVQRKRKTTLKGFLLALQGIRTAFPEEMTSPWIQQAIQRAANLCTESLLMDLRQHDDVDPLPIYREIHEPIIEALLGAL